MVSQPRISSPTRILSSPSERPRSARPPRHDDLVGPLSILADPFITLPLLALCQSIKGALVSNSTLAEISRAYSLHTQLRAHPAQIAQLRNNLLVRAQLFEASVAAISTHQGLAPTLDWLKLLFQPLLTKLYEVAKEAHQAKLAGSRAAQMEAEVFVSYVAAVEMWRMKKGRAPMVVEYVKTGTEGPPHKVVHFGTIKVNSIEHGTASGEVWKDVRNQ